MAPAKKATPTRRPVLDPEPPASGSPPKDVKARERELEAQIAKLKAREAVLERDLAGAEADKIGAEREREALRERAQDAERELDVRRHRAPSRSESLAGDGPWAMFIEPLAANDPAPMRTHGFAVSGLRYRIEQRNRQPRPGKEARRDPRMERGLVVRDRALAERILRANPYVQAVPAEVMKGSKVKFVEVKTPDVKEETK